MKYLVLLMLLLVAGCKVVTAFSVDHHFYKEDTKGRAEIRLEQRF